MTGTIDARRTSRGAARQRTGRSRWSRQAMLRVRFLGSPEVFVGDTPIVFARRKSLALFCYLVVTRRPHARSALAMLFWDELSESQAMSNLRKALTEIRCLVGPFVQITRQTVGIDPDLAINVDTERFEQLLADGFTFSVVAHLESALRIYQDDFLSGFNIIDSQPFEEWSLLQRERYQSLFCQGLEMSSTLHYRQGDDSAALKCAEQLVAVDPLREGAHRQIMNILARRGQFDAMRAQFNACCRILADELGVEPSEETTALFERLLRTSGRPQHNLPVRPSKLIGYRRELSQISARLLDPECRVVSLIGLGGSGKTRLALEAAHTLLEQSEADGADRFADGVRFVDLTRPKEPRLIHMPRDELTLAIAQALELPIAFGTDIRNMLFNSLRDKRLLLILDGVDGDLDALDVLEDILASAPNVKLLLTSRIRTGLDTEWIITLPGLTLPQSPFDLEQADASRFFMLSAVRSQPSFILTKAERPYVARICQLVGGLPLALTLASQWLRVMSCSEIADELEQNLDLLSTKRFGSAGRHSSIKGVLVSSFRLAAGDEMQALRKLCRINGSFTPAAALNEGGVTRSQLLSLVEMQMLVRSSKECFEVHPLVHRLVKCVSTFDLSATLQDWFPVVKLPSRRIPALERRSSFG